MVVYDLTLAVLSDHSDESAPFLTSRVNTGSDHLP